MRDPQQDGEVLSSARERLLSAALEVLFERGYRGATSREIARAAQVNEVTLFRLFSTKDDLLAAALVRRSKQEQDLLPAPTGDLEADLETMAKLIFDALCQGGYLMIRLLPEIGRLPDKQHALVREAFNASQEALVSVFRHYQAVGRLRADLGDYIWIVFVGPILTSVIQAESRQQPLQFDPHLYVQLFLHGCATNQGK